MFRFDQYRSPDTPLTPPCEFSSRHSQVWVSKNVRRAGAMVLQFLCCCLLGGCAQTAQPNCHSPACVKHQAYHDVVRHCRMYWHNVLAEEIRTGFYEPHKIAEVCRAQARAKVPL